MSRAEAPPAGPGLAGARVLCLDPVVAVVDGLATGEECAALVAHGAASGRLARAEVTGADQTSSVAESRTNRNAGFRADETPVLEAVCKRIAGVIGLDFARAEPPVLLHYAPGETFKPHWDGFPLDIDEAARATLEAMGGQRLFTTLLYLNEVAGGGTTRFPRLGLEVAPAPGRLLLFANTDAGSRKVARRSLHAGDPVTAGEKWVLTLWWRERPAEPR